MDETNDERGSHWRRWDPHVHMPGTVLEDRYRCTIEEALHTLAASGVSAAGITDYVTTASYRAAEVAWRAGAGKGIEFLFPNVELRLDVPTTKGKGVNIHLLCEPAEIESLEMFLGNLTFSAQGNSYPATRPSLVLL